MKRPFAIFAKKTVLHVFEYVVLSTAACTLLAVDHVEGAMGGQESASIDPVKLVFVADRFDLSLENRRYHEICNSVGSKNTINRFRSSF